MILGIYVNNAMVFNLKLLDRDKGLIGLYKFNINNNTEHIQFIHNDFNNIMEFIYMILKLHNKADIILRSNFIINNRMGGSIIGPITADRFKELQSDFIIFKLHLYLQ